MRDAQLQCTRGAFVQHARTGQPAMRNGTKLLAGGMAPSGINPCKPGGPNGYVYLCTSHANPEHWRRLLQVIGQKPMLDDPRFATHEAPASAALFKSIRAVLASASCRSPVVMQARPTAPSGPGQPRHLLRGGNERTFCRFKAPYPSLIGSGGVCLPVQ